MKIPIDLVLNTGGNCNLKCPACPAGRKEYNLGNMTHALAERIVRKACDEAFLISGYIYCFSEPFTNPDIVRIAKLFLDRKIPMFASTNLNIWKNIPEFMALEPDNLIVSTSGWTQSVYDQYHIGGNVERVKQNMVELSKIRRPKTFVRVTWHNHDYNAHEKPLMEKFAKELGFKFTSYSLSLLPLERALARFEDGEIDPAEKYLSMPIAEAKERCYERRYWHCMMQGQVVVVDANGDVELCMDRNSEKNKRGSFFDRSVADIIKARKTDFTCLTCKAVGGHVYGQQAYGRSRWSVQRFIEDWYRKLHLQRFPKASERITTIFYPRPK